MRIPEEELLTWLENFTAVALKYKLAFAPIFSSPINILDQLEDAVAQLRAAITYIKSAQDWTRAYVSWKNIGLYLREPITSGALPPPSLPATMPPTAITLKGVVAFVEEKVALLRVHPAFTQIIAEEFDVIPKAPTTPDLANLSPNVRAKNMGGENVLTWRGAASIKGVAVAVLSVDRADGEGIKELVRTTQGRYIDNHVQPERACAWVYYVHYLNDRGNIIGVGSEATVSVKAVN
jgi:hypothetical protein